MRIRVGNFADWREQARALIHQGVNPHQVFWEDAVLGDDAGTPPLALNAISPPREALHVAPAFMALAQELAWHRDPLRWQLLYGLLWKSHHETSKILDIVIDPDVARALRMQKQIHRDIHKMHAFVRFRNLNANGESESFGAWYEPDHRILRAATPFFARRFAAMKWLIATPEGVAVHDPTLGLRFEGPDPRIDAESFAQPENWENLWKNYYAHIFNPARVKVRAMKREMPTRFWKHLPEASLIEDLLKEAPQRVDEMARYSQAKQARPQATKFFDQAEATLAQLKESLRTCRACALCEIATQAVAGEGPQQARVVLVGEQPGDQEDRSGRPFVGPAGQLLRSTLDELGIDPAALYLTNAVKHFYFENTPTKMRLHKKPKTSHIRACRPWLEKELALLKPDLIVCLGASAAQAVLGLPVRINEVRGQMQSSPHCARTLVTYHPSALLRASDENERQRMLDLFRQDLSQISRVSPQVPRA